MRAWCITAAWEEIVFVGSSSSRAMPIPRQNLGHPAIGAPTPPPTSLGTMCPKDAGLQISSVAADAIVMATERARLSERRREGLERRCGHRRGQIRRGAGSDRRAVR